MNSKDYLLCPDIMFSCIATVQFLDARVVEASQQRMIPKLCKNYDMYRTFQTDVLFLAYKIYFVIFHKHEIGRWKPRKIFSKLL